jgi:hypothetical protein
MPNFISQNGQDHFRKKNKKQLWVVKVTHFQPQLRVHNLLAALPQWICFEASELREGSHLR